VHGFREGGQAAVESSARAERPIGRGFVGIEPPPKLLSQGGTRGLAKPGRRNSKPRPLLVFIANIGPDILVTLADTDAGNVVTAAQSEARWGYRLLPLLLGLIPVLYRSRSRRCGSASLRAAATASSSATALAACGRGSRRQRLPAYAAYSAPSKVFGRRLGAATRSFTLKRG
jgi:hypothetical protein